MSAMIRQPFSTPFTARDGTRREADKCLLQ
jgi:hypothetical protein